jgi:hypothetical protein
MISNIEEWVNVAGVVLQLGALAIVIYQLARLNLSIRVSAQAAIYQQASSARSFLVEYPELRKYFFDDVVAEPGSADHARAQTVAEMFLNYMEHLLLQKGSLRAQDWTAWRSFVCESLDKSPIMREVLDRRRNSFSAELVEVLDECDTR